MNIIRESSFHLPTLIQKYIHNHKSNNDINLASLKLYIGKPFQPQCNSKSSYILKPTMHYDKVFRLMELLGICMIKLWI